MYLKIAHRGASGYEPENTIRSFKKALTYSIDMIELDVRVCKSGELVVIHDDKVNRVTNGIGYVADMTFAELKKLDAGNGQAIPTIQETLNFIDRRIPVNIELKHKGTAKPVAECIKYYIENRNWLTNMFLVSSFDHYELKVFKSLYPEIRTSAIITGIPIGYTEFATKVDAYSVQIDIQFINQNYIDDAHERGLKVFAYTVNHEEDIKKICNMGVDGIISNYPDKL